MEQLVRQAKNGDREAFAQLYAQCADRLYSTAFYLLGRKEDAEDIVMETVLDAFRSIASLRDSAAFEGWLFRILVNKCKRKRGTYLQDTLELMENSAQVAAKDTFRNYELETAVRTLSEEEQQIVILSVVNGYQSKELAEILGLNANTVRSKQKRALEKLRNHLTERGMEG